MPQQNKQSQFQAKVEPQVELMVELKEQLIEELKREIKDELKKELKQELLVEKKTNRLADKQTQSLELEKEPQKKIDPIQKEVKREVKKELKKELRKESRNELKKDNQTERDPQQHASKLEEFMATLIEKLNKQIKVDQWATKIQPKREYVLTGEDLFDRMSKRLLEEFVLQKKVSKEQPAESHKKEPLNEYQDAISEKGMNLRQKIAAMGKKKEYQEAQFEKNLEETFNAFKAFAQQAHTEPQQETKFKKELAKTSLEQPMNLNDFKEFSQQVTQSKTEEEDCRLDSLKELQIQKKIQMAKLTKEFRAAMALSMRQKQLIQQEQQKQLLAIQKPSVDQKLPEDVALGQQISEFKATLDSLGISINQIKQELIIEKKQPSTNEQETQKEAKKEGKQECKQESKQEGKQEGKQEAKNISKETMEQRKAELQKATAADNIHTMVVKVSENCFRNCVSSYSTSLEPQDRTCINDCMSTYIESYRLVNRAFVNRVHAEHRKRTEQREEQQREREQRREEQQREWEQRREELKREWEQRKEQQRQVEQRKEQQRQGEQRRVEKQREEQQRAAKK